MARAQSRFSFQGMHAGYPYLRDLVLSEGTKVNPRGKGTTELLGVSFDVADAVNRGVPLGTGRKVGIKMQAIDGLSLLSGYSYHDVNTRLVKIMDGFGDNFPSDEDPRSPGGAKISPRELSVLKARYPGIQPGERFQQGAYGPRIGDQLELVEKQLRQDKFSRQAVVNLFADSDRDPSWNDRPCGTHFQFLWRDGALDMFVYFRSNDLRRGVAYDVWATGQIQAAMANVLGFRTGTMHWYAASLHIYDEDAQWFVDSIKPWENADTPGVDNPRESWGPEWDYLPLKSYRSWRDVRARFNALYEGARYNEIPDPENEVEEWYADVLRKSLDPATARKR